MNKDTDGTEVVAEPTTQETDVEESLDDVLSEFDQGIQATDTPDETQADTSNDPVRQLAEQFLREKARNEVNTAVENAIKTMKEITGDGIPDKALEGYLNITADNDPRFKQAFLRREENPQAWERAVKSAARELGVSNVDKGVTDDVATVVEAVSKSSTKESPTTGDAAPSEADMNRWSDAEFSEWERKQLRG